MKIDQIPKIRPFFQSARHADSKNAKKLKKFDFLKIFFLEKTYKESRNLSKFLFKKVTLMCMSLHMSFKKNVQFVLKVVIWALKAKKWPCPPLPIKSQNTVKKLGIDLSFSSSLVCAGFRRKKLT